MRLSFTNQLLIALSIAESSKDESESTLLSILIFVGIKLLKQKLVDYHNYGKPEPLPEYAVHRILYLLATHPELVRSFLLTFYQNNDDSLKEVAQYIKDSNPLKVNS